MGILLESKVDCSLTHVRALQAESCFEHTRSVARYRQLGFLWILQPRHHGAAEPGMQLEQMIEIQNYTPMDSNETRRIQFVFELGDGLIHDIIAFRRRREGELAAGEEVSHAPDLDQLNLVA